MSATREDWLIRAADILIADVLSAHSAAPRFCISVGFPKGRHGRGKAVGQCWSPKLAKDGLAHIFISPERDGEETNAILATVLHELIHASVGTEAGHRGAFAKTAKAVGMLKPFTSSVPDESLIARLNAASVRLGPYPHGALVPLMTEKKPGSRLRLWECGCGIKARVASDDFDAVCNVCGSMFERKDADA